MEATKTPQQHVPVLIVGAGPVGLAMAIDLAWRGIKCMLIERTDGSINTPKLGAVGIRTMELCRRWNIADAVRATPYQRDWGLDMVFVTTIAGHLLARIPYPSLNDDPIPQQSPEKKWRCPQLWFDPALTECARAYPSIELRYRTQLDSFEDRGNQVVAQLSHLDTLETETVTADFMIGCDGGGSTVRRALGIEMHGKRALDYSVAIFFRSRSLARDHDKGDAERYYFVGREGWWGNISAMDGRELWRLTVPSSEAGVEQVVRDADKWVRRALGTDAIPFEIISALPWRRSQLTAESYGRGRVFIAGDSAHTMSPTGGLGMNTGMGDVDNLGWKLQAVLEGWGGSALLDSYTTERKPIGERNAGASAGNYFAIKSVTDCSAVLDDTAQGEAARQAIGQDITAAMRNEWEQLGVHLGYRYEGSPVVVSDGTPEPEDTSRFYTQTSRPGHRAPHVWLEGGATGGTSEGRSTLDLFGRGFVLLRLGKEAPDVSAFSRAAAERHMPLEIIEFIRPDVVAAYERQLVLVRPDGHVAWRGDAVPDDIGFVLDSVRGLSTDAGSREPSQTTASADLN